MEMRRRATAFLAIVAIACTALWPLASSVGANIAGEAAPLCHQAGMQVSPDEMPQGPEGPRGDGKTHCPLCIMAFHAAFAAPMAEPVFHFVGRSVTLETYEARLTHRVAAHLPESRAPPA
jgi:hypothetical protein